MNRPSYKNFEDHIQSIPEPFKGALIDTMDTTEMIKRWLDGAQVSYTAADLIEFTKIVLERVK